MKCRCGHTREHHAETIDDLWWCHECFQAGGSERKGHKFKRKWWFW